MEWKMESLLKKCIHTGVSKSVIKNIKNRRSWKHISKYYNVNKHKWLPDQKNLTNKLQRLSKSSMII